MIRLGPAPGPRRQSARRRHPRRLCPLERPLLRPSAFPPRARRSGAREISRDEGDRPSRMPPGSRGESRHGRQHRLHRQANRRRPARHQWAVGTEVHLVNRLARAASRAEDHRPERLPMPLHDDVPHRPLRTCAGRWKIWWRAKSSTRSKSTTKPANGPWSRWTECWQLKHPRAQQLTNAPHADKADGWPSAGLPRNIAPSPNDVIINPVT